MGPRNDFPWEFLVKIKIVDLRIYMKKSVDFVSNTRSKR